MPLKHCLVWWEEFVCGESRGYGPYYADRLQTEMRKSLQSRYDRETAEMGAALRKEIGEVREAVAEGAVGVEELRRIVGKLEGRLRLDEEVVVDTVRGKQERLNGDDSARER